MEKQIKLCFSYTKILLFPEKFTLTETNISHPKAVVKMSFLSHWWDMGSFPRG